MKINSTTANNNKAFSASHSTDSDLLGYIVKLHIVNKAGL